MIPTNTSVPTDKFRVFLVSYHITLFRKKPYDKLLETLQSTPTRYHLMNGVWLLGTYESPSSLQHRLRSHLDEKDELFMMEIKQGTRCQGLLPNNAWNWLRTYVGGGKLVKIGKSIYQLEEPFKKTTRKKRAA